MPMPVCLTMGNASVWATFRKAQVSFEARKSSFLLKTALPCGFKRVYAFECSIAEPVVFGKGFAESGEQFHQPRLTGI
jgi:hypothetical protein